MPKTMFEKIWDSHVVHEEPGTPAILYIDLHLVHEVTSPQAFEGLRMSSRNVRRPDLTIATVDHNIPTTDRFLPITDPISLNQVETLTKNVEDFGITYYGRTSPGQGIVHIIGPEQGYTQPGKTIVCGDSHTSTHGAFGALAIGTFASVVDHGSVTVALPSIAKDFQTDLPSVQWVVIGYALTISALLLPMGRLAEVEETFTPAVEEEIVVLVRRNN